MDIIIALELCIYPQESHALCLVQNATLQNLSTGGFLNVKIHLH